MIAITDDQLAALYMLRWRPVAGVYAAPAAIATWDGRTLTLAATGQPLSASAAALVPRLELALHGSQRSSPPPVMPTIAALEADYPAATAALAAWWPVAAETVFLKRLPGCRACGLWDEAGRAGSGSCASINAACACRRLWAAGERCPEGKWPA